MTYILKHSTHDDSYFFDDYEELYEWVFENLDEDERSEWTMIDEDGDRFDV